MRLPEYTAVHAIPSSTHSTLSILSIGFYTQLGENGFSVSNFHDAWACVVVRQQSSGTLEPACARVPAAAHTVHSDIYNIEQCYKEFTFPLPLEDLDLPEVHGLPLSLSLASPFSASAEHVACRPAYPMLHHFRSKGQSRTSTSSTVSSVRPDD